MYLKVIFIYLECWKTHIGHEQHDISWYPAFRSRLEWESARSSAIWLTTWFGLSASSNCRSCNRQSTQVAAEAEYKCFGTRTLLMPVERRRNFYTYPHWNIAAAKMKDAERSDNWYGDTNWGGFTHLTDTSNQHKTTGGFDSADITWYAQAGHRRLKSSR